VKGLAKALVNEENRVWDAFIEKWVRDVVEDMAPRRRRRKLKINQKKVL
jgi:hypothetical protein